MISGSFSISSPDSAGEYHCFSAADGTLREGATNIQPADWFQVPVPGLDNLLFQWGVHVTAKDTTTLALGANGVRLHFVPLGTVTRDNDLLSRPAATRENYDLSTMPELGNIQGHSLGIQRYRETSTGEPFLIHGDAKPSTYVLSEDVLMARGSADFTADKYFGGIFEVTTKTYNTSAWPAGGGTQIPTPLTVRGIKKLWVAVLIYTPSYTGTFTSVNFDFKIVPGGK